MKLYYSPNLNPRVAVAMAKYLDAPVEYIRPNFKDPEQREAFSALNPNGLFPVLVESNRTTWETDAIVCRLCEITGSDLWRRDDEMVDMIKWISWGTHHLTKAADWLYFYLLIMPQWSDDAPDPDQKAENLSDFRKHAAILDAHLADHEWLVGDRISYADFRVATSFPFAKGAELPIGDFPNITRWNDQLMAIEAWRDPFKGLET